jgi:hypothetical protein
MGFRRSRVVDVELRGDRFLVGFVLGDRAKLIKYDIQY